MSYINPCSNLHDLIANLRQLAKEYPAVPAIDLGTDGGLSSVGFATFNFQIHGWLSTLINANGLNGIDPARTVNIKIRPDETVFELVRFLQRHGALQTSGTITPAMLADALKQPQSGGGKVTITPTGAAGESKQSEDTKLTGGKRTGRKPLNPPEDVTSVIQPQSKVDAVADEQGFVKQPNNPDAYQSATWFIEKYPDKVVNIQHLHELVDKDPAVRKWKPSPQRFNVHINDFDRRHNQAATAGLAPDRQLGTPKWQARK